MFAKFFQNKLFWHGAYAGKRINAKFFKMALRAFPDTPNIRKGRIKPDVLLKKLVIQHADAVFTMFRANIKRHFGKKQVCAYACRCRNARLC